MLTELKELRAKNEGKYNQVTYKMTNLDMYHRILNHTNFYAWSTANLQMLYTVDVRTAWYHTSFTTTMHQLNSTG